ncbi:pro-sigmaK processing inhibitor BofA family protein [Salimicrobium halophilum]|uniref:Inhibitor of the pro-sigma K processing machinery n=1 Tax=Salimicrobium halophilum TaxID=86666 RepID=A0A1G8UML3_9BACI|nr:pro-sigmaK processing inhibitor BofA family protein [Salimicrobium halophilum]SDJ55062.1 inhibitor of the pro-sigma K processing machinery [Salimicrobium halophilum]
MDPGLALLFLLLVIPMFLFAKKTTPAKWTGHVLTKGIIAVLFLFFVNLFGGSFGLHVPINLFTTTVTALLGIPGLATLIAIQAWVI